MKALQIGPGAVGLGWRPELAADLLAAPASADLVEVVAETCFVQPLARREAQAIAEIWPVVPHGVKLSLGSAAGFELEKARKLGALARDLRAPMVTEHVALTHAGGREIGHLTTLPFTRDAIRVLARNVDAARRVLPDIPLLLENVAWTLRWPEDAMAEGDFYAEVVAATGCDLLLDVANLYANATNAGIAPAALLRSYPLERVAMLHLAGGALQDGFYVDTHADPVPGAVFELLPEVFARAGAVPSIVERDAGFGRFDELVAEMERVRAAARAAAPHHPIRSAPRRDETRAVDAVAGRQAALAELLASSAPIDGKDAAGFHGAALARTRAILQHKRVDDALPLLPHSARGGDALRAIAFTALRGTPRPAEAMGIVDALRIATAAAVDPALAPLARLDLLELRTRFAAPGHPRLLPFLGRDVLPDGRCVWAFKGPGRGAFVHLFGSGMSRAQPAGRQS